MTNTETKPKTGATTTHTASIINDKKVVDWRRSELERVGYATATATKISERGDIDLHAAMEMRENGCTDELAVEILF